MGGLAMFWNYYGPAIGDVVELGPKVTLADRFGVELLPLRAWTGGSGLRLVTEDAAGNREAVSHPLPSAEADRFLVMLDSIRKAALEETCRDQDATAAACRRLKARYLELLAEATGLDVVTSCAPVTSALDDSERDVLAMIEHIQRAEDSPRAT